MRASRRVFKVDDGVPEKWAKEEGEERKEAEKKNPNGGGVCSLRVPPMGGASSSVELYSYVEVLVVLISSSSEGIISSNFHRFTKMIRKLTPLHV